MYRFYSLIDQIKIHLCILFSENTNSNDTQSQKSSCTTEDTMSTQDSRLEFILEGINYSSTQL